MRQASLMAAAILLALWPHPSLACTCVGPSHEQAVRSAAMIFAAYIGDVQPDPDGYRYLVTMDVMGVWRGDVPESLIMRIEQSSACGYPFEAGERYLVYMYAHDVKRMEVGLCSGTGPLERLYFDRYLLGEPVVRYDDSLETVILDTLIEHVGRPGDEAGEIAWQFQHFRIETNLLLPRLVRMAQRDLPGNQLAAVRAIGSLGEPAASAWGPLEGVFNSWARKDSLLRLETFRSMARVGRKNERFETIHLRALGDPDPGMRVEAVYAISGRPGERSAEIQKGLIACLEDEDARVRRAAIKQLTYHDKSNAVVQRIRRMERGDPDAEVRGEAGHYREVMERMSHLTRNRRTAKTRGFHAHDDRPRHR